jgi:hypothetical protein
VLLAGGSVADNTAEASGDYAVVVPAGNFITQSEGSFPAEVGGANETGSGGSNDGSNSYSLQMNTNAFETQACNSSTNFECRGWVQFVYDAAQGQLFIENSLLDYAGSCPSGYPQEYYLGSEHVCFMNSDSISVPKVAPSALSTVSMTVWTAFAPEVVFNTPNPTLNISFQVGSQTYVYSLYDYLGLMGNWTGSEFNVVGQDGGGAATFTSPTTLGVQVLVVPNGETRVAPICATGNTQFTGDTGETNNLGLGSCCPFGGDALGIQFVESNLTIGQIPIVSECPSLAVDGSTIAQATGSFDGTIQVTSSFTVPAYVAGGLLDSTLDGGLQPHDCQVTPPAPPQDQTVIGTASAPSDLNTPEITFAVPPGSNGQSWTQVISCDIGGPPFYELVESTAPVIPPDVLQIQDAPIVGGTPRVTIPANSYGAIYVGWSGPWVSADGADGAAISWTFNSIATTVIAAQTATGMRLQVSPPPLAEAGNLYPGQSITVTDAASGITQSVLVDIYIAPCVPVTCSAGQCGTISSTNGCGGPAVVCPACGSGEVCSDNVCCQTGTSWNASFQQCVASCKFPYAWCPATQSCATVKVCKNANLGG